MWDFFKNHPLQASTDVYRQNKQIELKKFKLYQNFPNPFNSSTVIYYTIQHSGSVTLKIYDIIGREISTLVNEFQPSNSYQVNFDANKLTSGVYLYALTVENRFREVRKMLFIR